MPSVKSIYCLAALLTITLQVDAAVITYSEDASDFANPERGFFYQLESRSNAPDALSNYGADFFASENQTVIRRTYNMLTFRNSAISPSFLDHIAADFVFARTNGLKLNIRFAYTFNEAPPNDDAPLSRILSHITQLQPMLQANADVISHLDAGFIGRWGEWHTSSNNNDNTATMTTVLAALHAALPASRAIVVRTPGYKRAIFARQTAITAAEAFSGSAFSRTGHLNDCFLASADDAGTYVPNDPASIAEQRAYISADARYAPVSGETCRVNTPRSDCTSAVAEMALLHWSALNFTYHPDVLQSWRNGGCFDTIRKRLGYRFVLQQADLPTQVVRGGRLQGSIRLRNIGFAAPYNARGLELVLRATLGGAVRRLTIPADPRLFGPDDNAGVTNIDLDLLVPNDLPLGNYEMLLNLPDPMPALNTRPAYSIRMANIGTWEASSGYNKLLANTTVVIGDAIFANGLE
jgi:Domain of unknown function (DUF4832)/Domain of unknown function (DUF4874)